MMMQGQKMEDFRIEDEPDDNDNWGNVQFQYMENWRVEDPADDSLENLPEVDFGPFPPQEAGEEEDQEPMVENREGSEEGYETGGESIHINCQEVVVDGEVFKIWMFDPVPYSGGESGSSGSGMSDLELEPPSDSDSEEEDGNGDESEHELPPLRHNPTPLPPIHLECIPPQDGLPGRSSSHHQGF
jgi:hypothetical protein